MLPQGVLCPPDFFTFQDGNVSTMALFSPAPLIPCGDSLLWMRDVSCYLNWHDFWTGTCAECDGVGFPPPPIPLLALWSPGD